MSEKSARRGIQSVEIGMRVLSAVAQMPGASSLSAIAQRAGISSSQTHRYLSSLMAAGMILQEGRSGVYDLAAGAIRIGLAALSRIDAFDTADSVIRQLVAETRRTSFLAVWGDAGPTIVRWFPGSPPVMTALTLGSTLPLLRSATGRVFFAFGERTEMDRQLRLVETSDPASVPSNPAATRDEIRQNGYVGVEGDLIPGLRAMAAPVLDLQGNLVMSVSLVAGLGFPSSGDGAAATSLVNACRQISESIGAQLPEPAEAPGGKEPRRSARRKDDEALKPA